MVAKYLFWTSQVLFTFYSGEVSKEYEKLIPEDQRDEFLKSPVWTMLMSARKTRMDFSDDNLLSHFKLSFEECVSVVLKENFTDPLIDVLLSYPPSSTLNKTDDLELIEILARHHFQRKGLYLFLRIVDAYRNENLSSNK